MNKITTVLYRYKKAFVELKFFLGKLNELYETEAALKKYIINSRIFSETNILLPLTDSPKTVDVKLGDKK